MIGRVVVRLRCMHAAVFACKEEERSRRIREEPNTSNLSGFSPLVVVMFLP